MTGPFERILAYLLGIFLPPLLVGGMTVLTSMSNTTSVTKPPPLPPNVMAKTIEKEKARFKALFILGEGGTQVSDLLATYEILSESKFFEVKTAAPTYDLAPTTGQFAVIPDYSYNDAPAADLLIIPGMITQADKTFTDWISEKAREAQMVLVLSDGARIAAQAGLTQGRKATGHFLAANELKKLDPSANWTFGQRWVDDGKIVSSPGIAAAVDATLHVVDRMASRSVALKTARELQIPWNPEPSETDSLASELRTQDFFTLFLRGGFQWRKHQVGMVIYPGVSEIGLAAMLDLLPRSLEVSVFTVAPERKPIPSRHGLQLVPGQTVETIFRPQMIVVPSGLGPGGTPPPLDPLKTDVMKNWVKQQDVLVKNLVFDAPGHGYSTAMDVVGQLHESDQIKAFVGKLVGFASPKSAATQPLPGDSALTLWTPPLVLGLLGFLLVAFVDFKMRSRHENEDQIPQ